MQGLMCQPPDCLYGRFMRRDLDLLVDGAGRHA